MVGPGKFPPPKDFTPQPSSSSKPAPTPKNPIQEKVGDVSKETLSKLEGKKDPLKVLELEIAEANLTMQDVLNVLRNLKKREGFEYIQIPRNVLQFDLKQSQGPIPSDQLDAIGEIFKAGIMLPKAIEGFIKEADQFPRLKPITKDLQRFAEIRETIRDGEGIITPRCLDEIEKLVAKNPSNKLYIVDMISKNLEIWEKQISVTAISNIIKSEMGNPFLRGEILLRALDYFTIDTLIKGITPEELFKNISLNVPNLVKKIAQSLKGYYWAPKVDILTCLFKTKDKDLVWEALLENYRQSGNWNSLEIEASIVEKNWPIDSQDLRNLIKKIIESDNPAHYRSPLYLFKDLANKYKLPSLVDLDKILAEWLLKTIENMPDKPKDMIKNLDIIIVILDPAIKLPQEIVKMLDNLIIVVKEFLNTEPTRLVEEKTRLAKEILQERSEWWDKYKHSSILKTQEPPSPTVDVPASAQEPPFHGIDLSEQRLNVERELMWLSLYKPNILERLDKIESLLKAYRKT